MQITTGNGQRESYFYMWSRHTSISLTYLASRRSGVDPHLASSVAIIGLMLDLHEVRWTNDSRIRRVANITWRTCKWKQDKKWKELYQCVILPRVSIGVQKKTVHVHTHVLINRDFCQCFTRIAPKQIYEAKNKQGFHNIHN